METRRWLRSRMFYFICSCLCKKIIESVDSLHFTVMLYIRFNQAVMQIPWLKKKKQRSKCPSSWYFQGCFWMRKFRELFKCQLKLWSCIKQLLWFMFTWKEHWALYRMCKYDYCGNTQSKVIPLFLNQTFTMPIKRNINLWFDLHVYVIYTVRQKKFVTSSERRSQKSATSTLIILYLVTDKQLYIL